VRFASPETYTPKHLAERILTSKAALEGERKQVTVLFADMKGSMELLADRDPEEARKLLDPVLERMMEAVHRYEGTVNQVMGDGIMALFGAPLAHEDHAVRACYAALRMQESVGRYADEVQRSHGVPVTIRVGINSGEVVVRSIGSDLRMDYTAVGQTTHLAARMEQIARPGSILITGETLRLAEGFVQVRPLGPVPVRGLDAPVEVHELTGAGVARRRLEAAAARGLTRFVGREDELEALRQAQARASVGHGQIVAVVGEPGVGKSRLFWEFTHSHRTHGWLVLESGSVSYGKATPYLPVIDLLKGYFRIHDRDDQRAVREKVSGKLVTLDPALMPALPVFLSLLDVPVEDPRWQALDPPQRRQPTLDALKRLLFRESQVQPLCLVFEDLHWIDFETQALLDSLVESLPTARLLLLANYRPEYRHAWGSKTYYTQLRIDPLPPESAEELLRALLGADPSLESLKQLLIERTEGNPFFIEESARTLVETGILIGERGAYQLAGPLGDIRVPATVQAVLAARIDRLPPEEKRLLQCAAVIGKDVPFPLLLAIVELPEEAVRRGLGDLQAAEFLYEASLFPDLEYTFKHALTHEVVYGSLLQDRRRALHAAIVAAIERLHAGRLAEHAERLAQHGFRGELWEKAVAYLRQAGAKAFTRSANREAVQCFEQALAALSHLPESPATLEQAIDIRVELRRPLIPLDERNRVLGYLGEAEALARRLDDRRRLGWVSGAMCLDLWLAGHARDARECGKRADSLAEAVGDFPLRVFANYYLSIVSLASGDYQRAETLCRRNVESLTGDLSRERFGTIGFPAVSARAWLTWLLADRGLFDEAITHGLEGVRLAEALEHAWSLVLVCWGLGYAHGVKGELSEASRVLEQALALCERWSFTYLSPGVTATLGHVYALSGRIPEGLALLERLARAEEPRTPLSHSAHLVYLAEALMLAGRLDEAAACAERGLALAAERGERGFEAYALGLHGELALRRNRPDAESWFRRAMALAEELGMRPLVAHCHLGLGRLHRATARRSEARQHLATATAMFREMETRFWLEKAEAESQMLG
jgi:class 3 adenylate cyclase/tetratricopeptide (TPR) repeat protein